MIAFSPKIRHALNFALKHHAGQLRRNRKAPYVMHPMQVALILARYGRPDDELVAALLHDVVEDCVKDNAGATAMLEKIRAKFGDDVAAIVDGVTERKRDAHDRKLPKPVVRQNGGELLLDLEHAADREAVWERFSGGKAAVVPWYRSVHSTLAVLGFDGAIMPELDRTAAMLEAHGNAGAIVQRSVKP